MSEDRKQLEALAFAIAMRDERRADDPLFKFEAHPKQRAFIDAVFNGPHMENWLVCANRFGKSQAGAFIDACLLRFGRNVKDVYGAQATGSQIRVVDRAVSIWVSSTTFSESRDIMQPKLFDNGFCPPGAEPPLIPFREYGEHGWRVSDKILKLKNGSLAGFKSADSGVNAYKGTEKDAIHFDEEHPKEIYNEAGIRVGAGKQLRIYGTATLLPPPGQVGGVTWVYSDILRPFAQGLRHDVGCFGGSIYDNPYILPSELRRLEASYPPHTIEGRIRLGGEWLPGLSGARAYPSFDATLHIREQPEPLPRRPLIWCWDFNVEPLITTVGQRDGKLFRFIKEFKMEEGNVPAMCDIFQDFYPAHRGEVWVYGDATGKGRRAQTGISDYRTIQNEMRRYASPVRLKVPEVNPAVPDRLSAVNRALKNEDGEIMVEVDPSCVELISDFEQVLRDPNGGIKKTSDRSNPYFQRTHSSDGVGYWIAKEEPVRRISDVSRENVIPIRSPGYAFAG